MSTRGLFGVGDGDAICCHGNVNKHAKNGMHKEEKMRKNNPRFHHLLFLVLDGLF